MYINYRLIIKVYAGLGNLGGFLCFFLGFQFNRQFYFNTKCGLLCLTSGLYGKFPVANGREFSKFYTLPTIFPVDFEYGKPIEMVASSDSNYLMQVFLEIWKLILWMYVPSLPPP